jgi:hypothetical protein
VSTPSTTDGSSSARGLRDHPLGRVAILLVVLALALLVARGCGSSGEVSKDEAIEIARKELRFEPECVQIRFVRRGIQALPFWAVSLWTLDRKGEFDQISLVFVNAHTGAVADVNRRPAVGSTQPQCESPV